MPYEIPAEDDDESVEAFLDRVREVRAGTYVEPEPEPISGPSWDDIVPHLDEVPEVERLIVEGLRQGDRPAKIAAYLGLDRENFAWRARRAVERLRLLSRLPRWSADDVLASLLDAGVDHDSARMMAILWLTSSQTRTAREVRRSQSYVSRRSNALHRELRDMGLVREDVAELARVLAYFTEECLGLRVEPERGWRMPTIPGGYSNGGGPKAGQADLRDAKENVPKSKASESEAPQLAFGFATLPGR